MIISKTKLKDVLKIKLDPLKILEENILKFIIASCLKKLKKR